jgi:cell division septum initiation protein DivIVA
VALDRQSIEKKDFPIGRRGYDPDAVDSHLSGLAEEVEDLKRSARRRTETLASAASEQVRAIVEAAETSAAEIQRQAEEEAREIRAEANSEAQSTREQATSQAREYVGKVSESTAVMLQRLDAMESELGALIDSLRTGANRLNADLQLLEGNLGEVREAVSPRPQFEPESAAAAAPIAPGESIPVELEPEVEPYDETLPEELAPSAGAVAPGVGGELGGAGAGTPSTDAETLGTSDDTEGARLIALNMALNGTPREETDRYLAENFQLPDRDGLLDEVYASVEG